MSSLLIDSAFLLFKLLKNPNARMPWNRKAPHISNFRDEKHVFCREPSFHEKTPSQFEKPASRFPFFKSFRTIKTSLTVWALLYHLFHLFHLHQRHFYMSNTSSHSSGASLLSSPHNSSISIATKPFFTRTSSIADDETTLCPSIPNSISFRSLDDLTVASGPSLDPFYTCETQRQANMSIGAPNSRPTDLNSLHNRPPHTMDVNETDDRSEDASANEATNPEPDTASSEETEEPDVVNGTPVEQRTAPASKKASPTDPMELFMSKQFESMFAGVQASLLEAQQKSIEQIIQNTIAPSLRKIDQFEATLNSNTKKATTPPNEVHCRISDDSPSKKSYASATNDSSSSTSNPKPPPSPSKPPASPTKTPVPPGFPHSTLHGHSTGPSNSHTPPRRATPFSMPIGAVYEEAPNVGSVYVKASATVRAITKARANSDFEDDGDINMQHIGTALSEACTKASGEFQVQLLKWKELTPSKAADPQDVRIQGQFLLGSLSCYSSTPAAQTRSLKQVIQHVIHNKTTASLTDHPVYVSAFNFDINSVNSSKQMIFALIEGIKGTWFDSKDHIALEHIVEEISKHIPLDTDGLLPKPLRTYSDRCNNIGCLIYTSSKTKENGRYGKAAALVYCPTEEGIASAQSILSTFNDDRVVTICGGIPISVTAFPANEERNGKPSPRSKKTTGLNAVDAFARNVILGNAKHCDSKYKLITLQNVTDAIFKEEVINKMITSHTHLVGVIPRLCQASLLPAQSTIMKLS
jgi:hypothetical protein